MDAPFPVVTLGHGSGGRLTQALVRDVFFKHLANPALEALGDAAALEVVPGRVAMTTDVFVVKPLFFPGGDIGGLGVNGTVNDLAVSGAVPLWLSAAFVLEEGFPLADLDRVAASMARAAKLAGVKIVTGDTKVVERGHGDGVFVATSGVGSLREDAPGGPRAVRPGDAVVVSGPVGDHGAVIAALRSGMELEGLASDCGSVAGLVEALYLAGVRPRFMRDPTRGGLATVLAELAGEGGVTLRIRETDVPIRPAVRSVCDILGLDPLYLACEGRLVAVVPAEQAQMAVTALRRLPEGQGATAIGEIAPAGPGPVVLQTLYGGTRVYDILASEQLPRIC
ncbi:MAG: hydrogenase expression/formation protein HypE [Deltaproteobacteria bacterium]|nr:hydrogenase expression/formation protein HypE [Deltaproteobacteria bacterium]